MALNIPWAGLRIARPIAVLILASMLGGGDKSTQQDDIKQAVKLSKTLEN